VVADGTGVHWRPVGPLPAAVYWRRRVLVLAGPLAALLLLRSCGGGADEPFSLEPSPTATPSAAASALPSATRAPATTGTCPDPALEVSVSAEPPTNPRSFLVTVVNRGTGACRRDLGPAAVALVVTSGADRVWARADCDRRTARELATLQPGASRAVRVTWDGRRSKPGCAGSRAAAAPGTYRVTGTVGTRALPAAVFRVRQQ
jgi:hypothetical protein